jgi:hypothetical protein
MRKRCLLGWMLMSGAAVTVFADLEGAEEAQDAGADEAGENSGAVAEVVGRLREHERVYRGTVQFADGNEGEFLRHN